MRKLLDNPFLDLVPENNDAFSPSLIEFLNNVEGPVVMIVSHADAERPELWMQEKERLDALWTRGAIGDAAYTASLLGIGYRPKDAAVELSILKMDKMSNRRSTWK